MKVARKKAIENYTLIANDYPTLRAARRGPLLPRVRVRAGERPQERALGLLRAHQEAPDSKYIPNAYLAFGELFFNEAQGDPVEVGPRRAGLRRGHQVPAADNKVYGYAWYKLAYVFWNKGELDKSLNAFKKTIEFGVVHTQLPGAAKLADSARRDVIPVYALKGDPAQAYNFLHNISGDPAGSNEKTFKMMDDLGNNYLDTGHYPEAIVLYKDLIGARQVAVAHCVYQAHITEATMAMKSGNKDVIVKAELDNQLEVAHEFKNGSYSRRAEAGVREQDRRARRPRRRWRGTSRPSARRGSAAPATRRR